MNKIKLFEGFSGYGSQKLAFKRLGIEVESVGISEIDPDAIIAYAALHCDESKYIDEGLSIETKRQILIDCNVGYDFQKNKSSIPRMKKEKLEKLYKSHILSINQGDISLIEGENLPDMDFFTYSFPCQSVSISGKQAGLSEGSGTKSSLLWQCKKVIDIKRPKYLIMENVKNLVGKNHKENFEKWLSVLDDFGYNNYWQVINAKNCGVPQNRERVFCVSVRKDIDSESFAFNEPFDSGLRLRDVLEKEVDGKYFFKRKKLNFIKNKNNGDIKGFVDVGSYELGNRVYDSSSVCFTLRAKKNDQLIMIGDNFRYLTPRECFRLMGLIDEEINIIKLSGVSESQQYKLAGNSIVVDCMFFLKNLFL